MKNPLVSIHSFIRAAVVCGLLFGLSAPLAMGQYYVRGDFNGWDTSFLMSDEGGGLYTYQATGLTPGDMYFFKIATEDWGDGIDWPGSNARVMADSNGEIFFRAFDQESWTDGWMPDSVRRVGYSDAGHGWEVLGSMTGWDASPVSMNDMGGGLYQAEVFLNEGSHEFKYRMSGSWDINIGGDFGNSADNIFLSVPADDTYIFQLDTWNGRHSVEVIPEPSTYALLFGLGVMGLAWLKRRRSAC